jgi:hypothetical protein
MVLLLTGITGCTPVGPVPGGESGSRVARVALTASDDDGRTARLGAADIANVALDGKPIPVVFTPAGELQLPEGDFASQRHLQVKLKDGGHVIVPLHQQASSATGGDLAFEATVQRQSGKAALGSVLPSDGLSAVPLGSTIVGAYFSVQQADDLSTNGPMVPLSNVAVKTRTTNLFVLLKALYPEVTFVLDWQQSAANGFAFIGSDGAKTVVINGALARQQVLEVEGMAMIAASLANHFTPMAPLNSDFRTALGACDYYAFATTSRRLWLDNDWTAHVSSAYTQIKSLMALIPSEHAQGDPAGQVDEPSIACRLQAMNSGFEGQDLPACAGGPVLP